MATTHTSKKIQEYLVNLKARCGISYLNNSDIPVKSSDISPMGFFGFGYLKQKLFLRKASTLDGLWKLIQEIWNEILSELTKKVFASWKRICRFISGGDGVYIEQIKKIQSRKIKS
jgi:hypothetical protein